MKLFKMFLLLTAIIAISAQNISAINQDELIKKAPYIAGIITTGAVTMYATKQVFELCKSLKSAEAKVVLGVLAGVGIVGIGASAICELAVRA